MHNRVRELYIQQSSRPGTRLFFFFQPSFFRFPRPLCKCFLRFTPPSRAFVGRRYHTESPSARPSTSTRLRQALPVRVFFRHSPHARRFNDLPSTRRGVGFLAADTPPLIRPCCAPPQMAHAHAVFAAFAAPFTRRVTPSTTRHRATGRVPTRALAAPSSERRGRGRGSGGGTPRLTGTDFANGRAIQSDLTSSTDPRVILDVVGKHASEFDPIHAATAMHRLATHARSQRDREAVVGDKRFKELMLVVQKKLPKMNSQGLANVAWACAKLEHHPADTLLTEIAEGLANELRGGVQSTGKARETKSQAVSNTVWAFGQLRFSPGSDLLVSLAASVAPLLKKFKAQELSNVLLGFAYLEFDPGAVFFDQAMRATLDNLTSFEGQETSNLLWACARIGRAPPGEVIDGLLIRDAAQNLGGSSSPLNMSQCLWACAKVREYHDCSSARLRPPCLLTVCQSPVQYRYSHTRRLETVCPYSSCDGTSYLCPDCLSIHRDIQD